MTVSKHKCSTILFSVIYGSGSALHFLKYTSCLYFNTVLWHSFPLLAQAAFQHEGVETSEEMPRISPCYGWLFLICCDTARCNTMHLDHAGMVFWKITRIWRKKHNIVVLTKEMFNYNTTICFVGFFLNKHIFHLHLSGQIMQYLQILSALLTQH